jgi:hypothetical protein
MTKYRKKPVVIEAIQYLPPTNCEEVWAFLGWEMTDDWDEAEEDGKAFHNDDCDMAMSVYIPTLEGLMEASPGDWIIRGIKGEHYPCKDDIFRMTYEPVDATR